MDAFLELVTRKFELPSLLLVSNYQDPDNIQGYTFYFIEFYVQLLVLASVLFSFPRVRAAFRDRPLISALILFAAVVTLDRTIELIWNGDYNFHRTPWHYGWCFCLGMVIAAAKDLPSKLLAMALSIACALAVWQFTSAAYYVVGGCAAVLFIRSIAVPASAKIVIAEIAGASMFVYLTHYQIVSVVQRVFGEPKPWLALVISVVTGILGAHAYVWAERKVLQLKDPERVA